ncbi:spore germination protein GerW family protein [Spongiactinospora sp. TRM90649]|uniref:spore germination protein GerW family protein n=1 Tax=Spongiactinospora sp. TRM90649 TaxID=3031114 RepID=UPI0023F8F38F|nr:spore germination protein GerW family protein [Spongiactinospora sp. TRM90649]MDF5755852.1 spore germination protein GerW family protein [Spongiactinospora sp. TRM90649]
MDVMEMVEQSQDAATVKRVFGEPITHDGVTVIPVARVASGGGGGKGKQRGEFAEQGSGGGYGLGAAPAGVFVIKDGNVRWHPALDINRLIIGTQIVAVIGLLTARAIVRIRTKGRRKSR